MLLEHDMPVTAYERAAGVWLHRQRIELEAADLFATLGRDLAALGHADLAERATSAADDEQRHAVRCAELVAALGDCRVASEQPRSIAIGPQDLSARDRVLYVAVAVGCITESLSCALLLALREAATHPRVRATIDEVLRDEIEHARIGWALLDAEAARRDVGWIARYLPAMARAAVDDEVKPMSGDDELAGLGVLPRKQVERLVSETWTSVIGPGLRRYGVASAAGAAPSLAAV